MQQWKANSWTIDYLFLCGSIFGNCQKKWKGICHLSLNAGRNRMWHIALMGKNTLNYSFLMKQAVQTHQACQKFVNSWEISHLHCENEWNEYFPKFQELHTMFLCKTTMWGTAHKWRAPHKNLNNPSSASELKKTHKAKQQEGLVFLHTLYKHWPCISFSFYF